MSAPTFRAHNIELGAGEQTIPGSPNLLADSPWWHAFLRTLDIAFPDDDRRHRVVADLGCLEGGYTVELARAGFNAVGIDARESNIAKCNYVAGHVQLPNLRFLREDVRNLERHGPFDAVLCSGLLYHLENPCEFLHMLGRSTRRVLLLQTHFAPESRLPALLRRSHNYHLSRLTTHEGNRGRWYREYRSRHPDLEKMEAEPEASWLNARSFWMSKRSLLSTMVQSGFRTVYEQYDFQTDIEKDRGVEIHSRSLFVGFR